MILFSPWEEPMLCPRSNRSMPNTFWPRRAKCQRVADPMPPMPITMVSNDFIAECPMNDGSMAKPAYRLGNPEQRSCATAGILP